MAYDIGPKIGIEGEAEFRAAIQNVNQQVKTLTSEMEEMVSSFTDGDDAQEQLAKQTEILNKQIKAQEEKVKLLNRGLEESVSVYGEADTKTLKWKETVSKAKTELNRMKDSLKDAENGVEDFGDAAADSEDGLGDLIKGLGDIKNFLIGGAVVTGIKEFAQGILDLEESTREYRAAMGTLEVAGQNAGYSIEQTYEVYRNLNGVMGDTQAAAEAATQLMSMRLNMEDLTTVTDATIGMWVALGQAAPIESIAEAVQQTIAAGTATGAFSDYLMAAGISEDEFNEKLGAANTTAERANTVLKLLSDEGLSQVGQDWKDVNEDIVKANESQDRMNESMGRLGEAVAPVADAIRNGLSDAIDWLVEKIEAALPMLEGMAEMAKKAWDAITGGENRNVYTTGQYGSRSVDGSHAAGLAYVPFDGYRAELHEGEMVIPASMAARMRSSANSAFTTMAEGMVNGMQTAVAGMGGGSYSFTLVMPDNTVLARYQLPALIDVANSNGTPILNPMNA